jgi:hypothetical protein
MSDQQIETSHETNLMPPTPARPFARVNGNLHDFRGTNMQFALHPL